MRQGQGKSTDTEGNIYEGAWEDGWRHGQGKYTYIDGEVYEGAWEDGRRHGQGKYTNPSGAAYEGAWENDKRHGQGKYTDTDGSTYEGEHTYGKRHGQGTLTRPSGIVSYEGAWEDGMRHGQGKYTDTDGRVIESAWENGKLMPPLYHLYLHRAVDEADSDDPDNLHGLGLYKLGYKPGAKGKRSRQSDYDVVGEWPVIPKGSTKAKRRRVMKAVESVFIDSLELRSPECQGAREDEFWLYNETAKAAAAKAAAATARVVTAHDAPQEQA